MDGVQENADRLRELLLPAMRDILECFAKKKAVPSTIANHASSAAKVLLEYEIAITRELLYQPP